MNIYVGNLPYAIQDDELREAFEAYGEVLSAEVIIDRRTQRSRGYGFVEMQDDSDARSAIDNLNGSDFHGRELRVDESKPKGEKSNGKSRNGQRRKRNQPHGAPASDAAAGGGVFGFIRRIFS